MRVTNSMMTNRMMLNINRNMTNLDKLYTQYASGKRINRPSDDPILASRALKFRTNVTETKQYQRNAAQATSWMDVTESSFNNSFSIMQKIRDLCVGGSSDVPLTSTDRQELLAEIEQLVKQIGSEMNITYSGRYVFSGYRTDQPYTLTADNPNASYSIFQSFSSSDIQYTKSYRKLDVTGEPVIHDVAILKLPYTGMGSVNIPGYTVNTVSYYSTEKDPYLPADGTINYIPETGELVLAGDVAKNFSSKAASTTFELTAPTAPNIADYGFDTTVSSDFANDWALYFDPSTDPPTGLLADYQDQLEAYQAAYDKYKTEYQAAYQKYENALTQYNSLCAKQDALRSQWETETTAYNNYLYELNEYNTVTLPDYTDDKDAYDQYLIEYGEYTDYLRAVADHNDDVVAANPNPTNDPDIETYNNYLQDLSAYNRALADYRDGLGPKPNPADEPTAPAGGIPAGYDPLTATAPTLVNNPPTVANPGPRPAAPVAPKVPGPEPAANPPEEPIAPDMTPPLPPVAPIPPDPAEKMDYAAYVADYTTYTSADYPTYLTEYYAHQDEYADYLNGTNSYAGGGYIKYINDYAAGYTLNSNVSSLTPPDLLTTSPPDYQDLNVPTLSTSTGNPYAQASDPNNAAALAAFTTDYNAYLKELAAFQQNVDNYGSLSEQYAALMKTSGNAFSVQYNKNGLEKGELNPLVAFSCIDYNDNNKAYTMDDQSLEYIVGVNTSIQVNSLGKDVYTDKMYADLMNFCQFVSSISFSNEDQLTQKYSSSPYNLTGDKLTEEVKKQQTLEEQMARSALQDRFSDMLDLLDRHTNNISTQQSNLGARMNRVELISERLDEDEASYEELLSKTEDADVVEVIMNLQIASSIYQAALQAGAKIIQMSLADYIR